MVTIKAIEFALKLINLVSLNNNTWQFIMKTVASPESSQLKMTAATESSSIFWEGYWNCGDSPLSTIVCELALLCFVTVLIRRCCQLQYVNEFEYLNLSVIMTLSLDMPSLVVFRVGICRQGVNRVLSYGHLHLINGLLICMGSHSLS